MNAKGLGAALTVAVALPAVGEGLELKGFKPGMSADDAKALMGPLATRCSKSKESIFTSCYYATKYSGRLYPQVELLESLANRRPISWLFQIDENQLASATVHLPTRDHEHIVKALTEKYGAPKSATKSTVQNRAGASFEQMETDWYLGGDLLRVRQRAGQIDEMSVMVVSTRSMERFQQESAEHAKKASKDL